jgi:ubiquinone/menaquinone biosynthesis C-methylase UbiE
METVKTTQPEYGNWVSTKLIGKTLAAGLVFAAAAAALLALGPVCGAWAVAPGAVLLLPAAFLIAGCIYFARARVLFGIRGGVQSKIIDLLMEHVRWDGQGRALDIGCGSGALAIGLAKKYACARVTGIDYWGGSWQYAQKQCEENAQAEGVSGRVEFARASASMLPFADDAFDLAVSNLVFHEVKDAADKRDAIKEALRVVKPGGGFVFQDLFLIRRYYGAPEELAALVKSWGVREVHFEDTSKSEFIPKALKLPFMVGTLGMLYGIK